MSPGAPSAAKRALCVPRASGDEPLRPLPPLDGNNVFPARAGMSHICTAQALLAIGVPRASGDEPR